MSLSRIAVKAQVVARLKALAATNGHALAGVLVTYNGPNKNTDIPSKETVMVGLIDGDQEATAMSSQTTTITDKWSLQCVVIVGGKATEQAADERAEAIVNAIVTALYSAPRLNTGAGAIADVGTNPGHYAGPNAGPTDGGEIESWASFEITFYGKF